MNHSPKTFKQYIDKPWDYDGMSAKCLFGFFNHNLQEYRYPSDPDDLCRVLQMLRLLPTSVDSKQLMIDCAGHYGRDHWRKLAYNWNQIMDIFSTEWDSGSAPKTYKYMQEMYENP